MPDIKEHVAVTIMASTASSSALAISIFAAQDLYYNVRPNAAVGIFTWVILLYLYAMFGNGPDLRLIGSQIIGYGTAGKRGRFSIPISALISVYITDRHHA